MEHFFPEFKWRPASDADQSQIIGGGMQMYTLLKLLGGFSQIIRGDISPRVSAPLHWAHAKSWLCFISTIWALSAAILSW